MGEELWKGRGCCFSADLAKRGGETKEEKEDAIFIEEIFRGSVYEGTAQGS